MQFTEIGFAIFLFIVFCLYWFVFRKHVRGRNLLILTASYVFYGWWDWRFLILIIITTLSTYFTAILTPRRHGKMAMVTNIVLNLGILAVFKYLGFFSENLRKLFELFGVNLDWFTVEVLLPVGISFYTFQAIGYSVDVYRRRVEPCRDIISFATFIAYFPQLVAGPIERASALLPQLQSIRRWDRAQAVSGLRMILFGVVKKVCIADILAIYVDRIFGGGDLSNPFMVLVGGILFSLEIYCDFSAYSEIARGTSRLLGVELMANFRFPYFSRNITEFWRRWHISLMMWFRDYLYIPLGGNRRGAGRTYFNLFIVFVLSGLWHGAAWNFVVWGAYWAIANIIGKAVFRLKNPENDIRFSELPKIVETFMVVAFGFYIFRCETWEQMVQGFIAIPVYCAATLLLWILAKGLTRFSFNRILQSQTLKMALLSLLVIAVVLLLFLRWQFALQLYTALPLLLVGAIEWKDRNSGYPLSRVSPRPYRRWILYWTFMLFALLSEPTDMSFIYFQF